MAKLERKPSPPRPWRCGMCARLVRQPNPPDKCARCGADGPFFDDDVMRKTRSGRVPPEGPNK